MTNIKVKIISENDGWVFDVVVEESEGSTEHRVRMGDNFYESLRTEVKPEEVVRESFEFLLERESLEN